MTPLEAMKQAVDYLRLARDYGIALGVGNTTITDAINNQLTAIEQIEKAEPVAWMPSAEWTACVKLPVVVHVRKQREGETHVSTREGITPIKPDDLIMRGVSGEEYPIGREIFEQTYRIGEHPATSIPPGWKLVPVEPTDAQLRAAIYGSGHYYGIYKAMLSAAPTPEGEK